MGGGYSPEIKTIIEAHANTFRAAKSIFLKNWIAIKAFLNRYYHLWILKNARTSLTEIRAFKITLFS
jgi:hypothetical protein